MSNIPLLTIKNLCISFQHKQDAIAAVKDSTFHISKNEIVGLVGESGSGKSITSLAIMGLLDKNATLSGRITFDEKELVSLPQKQFQNLRGNEIAMIFQEPMSALNPSLTCGFQVAEILKIHTQLSSSQRKKEVLSLFDKVKLPEPASLYDRYPHQLSGGQMQRVMIAMAIACNPKLLIADEPTTALDVTVQKEILQLLKEIQQETQMSILFISHDLALVSELVDRCIVMYQGAIIEQGEVRDLFVNPKETYTKALLAARPSMKKRLKKLPTILSITNKSFFPEEITPLTRGQHHRKIYTKPPLLTVQNIHKEYISKGGIFTKKRVLQAVNDVSFSIYEGETVGLVGESGCGKSTLGKVILQLEKATKGTIHYKGIDVIRLDKKQLRALRKDIQLIFQDPYSSLHPRKLIGEAILEPMKVHNIGTSLKQRVEKVKYVLDRVGLGPQYYHRYPHQLSGGQRQRVGIARTIALQPKLIVCDESVSALDISVQAQVLNLLNELKEDFGFTYLFISHDLAVVKYMADQLLVMNKGKIEEKGDADEIYANPTQTYTQKLIDAIPKGEYSI